MVIASAQCEHDFVCCAANGPVNDIFWPKLSVLLPERPPACLFQSKEGASSALSLSISLWFIVCAQQGKWCADTPADCSF